MRVGLGAGVASKAHVLDAERTLEAAREAQRLQHALGIGARRIGQQQLAPPQTRQRRAVVYMAAHLRFQAWQTVGLAQEVRHVHAVVADQAGERGAIAAPVAVAQRSGGVFIQAQLGLDGCSSRP